MIKETQLTDQYLKAITGKFDLEIIFELELENKNIASLGSIPKCISIVYLNLSQNKITSVESISCLYQLKFLNLSINNISDISPLQNLLELRSATLFGNNIDGPLPTPLKKLTKLEKLSFKTEPFDDAKKINVSNPICKMENYRNSVFSLLKNLKWLDNLSKNMEEFNYDEKDDNVDMSEKLDVNKYDFNFSDTIKLDSEELISKEELENTSKDIQDKYSEYQKNIEEVRKELQNMK